MVWDGLIFLALVALCMAGWNVGLINSWRGPIAMVIATIVTQQFYIDFGTWIAQQTLAKPDMAGFLAYLMMWLVVEISTEIILGLVLTWNRKDRPVAFDRAGGVGLAFVRWVVICTLPMMALQAKNKIPEAPSKDDGLINPFLGGIDDSGMVKFFKGFGKGFLPSLGPLVVSDKAPSFKPNFDRPKVELE